MTSGFLSRCSGLIRQWLDHPAFLPLCFLAFVFLRLGLILLVPVQPSSDAGWYMSRAITLAEDGTYSEDGLPTAFWPVGYPAFLGLLFKFTGPSVLAAQIANLLFACSSFWLLYRITRRLFGVERAARGAVLLLTVYPNNIAYVPAVLTEHMFTSLLLTASLLLLMRGRWMYVVIAGVILGIATLIKTQTIAFAPVLAFAACYDKWSLHPIPNAVARAAVVTLVALVTVAPWTIRNYNTFGSFILVSTNGGISMLAGNNPSMIGNYGRNFADEDPLVKSARFSAADQLAADKRARALAWGWIRENPLQFVGLVPQKVFRLWALDGEAEWQYQSGSPAYNSHVAVFRAVRIINQVFYLAILAVAAWTCLRLLQSRASPEAYFGFLLAALTTALCIVFSGQSRYHFPIMPFLLSYAALALFSSRGDGPLVVK